MRAIENKEDEMKNKYEVKGVKMHRGHEGEPLAQCTLYRNGKKVALYSDGDHGGEAQLDWMDWKAPNVVVHTTDYEGKPWDIKCTPEEAILYDHVKDMTWDSPYDTEKHKMEPDMYVSNLIDDYELAKRLKKAVKTKTLFILKEKGRELEYSTNQPYTPEVKERLEKKYGDKLVKILNTEFVDADEVDALAKKKAEQRMKRQCKTKTLFRLVDDDEGKYWIMKAVYSPIVKTRLEIKYGDKLAEIINEKYAA
jgi:hypothetical protein